MITEAVLKRRVIERFSGAEKEFILSMRMQRTRVKDIAKLVNEKFGVTRNVAAISQAVGRWKKDGTSFLKRSSPIKTSFDKPESTSQAIHQLSIMKDMITNIECYLNTLKDIELRSLKIIAAQRELDNAIIN